MKERDTPMNIMVFDTETTSIEKPFAYNIGYVVYNVETDTVLLRSDWVAEQIWHNRELFTTAYYADKREGYIGRMRSRTCTMEKIGYITQRMCQIVKDYEIAAAFAFNSPFDDRVFEFNCEWFKIKNPFDTIPIYDIRGYVHQFLAFKPEYQAFCDKHSRYTESSNYSTTAETVYQFLTEDTEFEEAHTALADAEIELTILKECVRLGGEWCKEYKVYGSVPRLVEKTLEVKTTEGERVSFPYEKITIYKEKENKTRIILRNREKKGGGV